MNTQGIKALIGAADVKNVRRLQDLYLGSLGQHASAAHSELLQRQAMSDKPYHGSMPQPTQANSPGMMPNSQQPLQSVSNIAPEGDIANLSRLRVLDVQLQALLQVLDS